MIRDLVGLELIITGDEPPDLEQLLHRPAWQADALCREHPEVDFFPDDEDTQLDAARAVCARCLVTAECLAFALAQDRVVGAVALHGVWGGTSRDERRARTPAVTVPAWTAATVSEAVAAWLASTDDHRGSAYVAATARSRTLPTITATMRALGVRSWPQVLSALLDAAA